MDSLWLEFLDQAPGVFIVLLLARLSLLLSWPAFLLLENSSRQEYSETTD